MARALRRSVFSSGYSRSKRVEKAHGRIGGKKRPRKLVQMGGASKSPGRSSTNKSSAKGSGKGGGGSIAYPRKAAAIPKWTVTAYIPPRKISDKELEAARKVSGE
jgi:hypothetical protein